MRHAGPAALDALEPVLAAVRTLGLLKEKSRGVFYLRGRAFLHFHEDPAGLFADLRRGDDFDRYPVNKPEQQAALLQAVSAAVAAAGLRQPAGA